MKLMGLCITGMRKGCSGYAPRRPRAAAEVARVGGAGGPTGQSGLLGACGKPETRGQFQIRCSLADVITVLPCTGLCRPASLLLRMG